MNDASVGYVGRRDRDNLIDDMMVADSITGNASGSRFCNSWKAEECLCHNWDLIQECIDDGIITNKILSDGPEAVDVCVRIGVLTKIANKCIDDWNEEHPED